MPVGDVNSTERGSGARYNDGKAKVEYIPARVLYDTLALKSPREDQVSLLALQLLGDLADFEEGRDEAIYSLLRTLLLYYLHATCDQFDFGAKKYAAWNWAKGMAWSIPIACIKRHLLKILVQNEHVDVESGVHHLGAVGCNAVMLIHFLRTYPAGDDRPPRDVFDVVLKEEPVRSRFYPVEDAYEAKALYDQEGA